jgi:hypothetical protein
LKARKTCAVSARAVKVSRLCIVAAPTLLAASITTLPASAAAFAPLAGYREDHPLGDRDD